MPNRFLPVLVLAFGSLMTLITVSAFAALRSARESYQDVLQLSERSRRRERLLSDIDSQINVIGLLARDYLLDPSNISGPIYRERLLEAHQEVAHQLDELGRLLAKEDVSQLQHLREQVDAYWSSLDPLFAWSPRQKMAFSALFLRKQVVPLRDSAVALANSIRRLARTSVERQRVEIDAKQRSIPTYIGRMLGITLLLGIIIGGASIYQVSILERRDAEQRQRAESAERELRRLSHQLVQAQEEERKSISRELHDEIGQMLTALRMELRGLQELRTASEPEFAEHLEDAKHLAEQSLRSLRDIAMGLRPSMLDDLGLGSAVHWQARQFSNRTGIPVNVTLTGALTALPDRHRTCVYRVVQEALTNCARHAAAKSIAISIANEEHSLRLAISDDGAGFDVPSARRRGLGLIGIEERIRELGGQSTIASNPGKGTAISARIPLQSETVKT
jgi:signal transduction histidine kinase